MNVRRILAVIVALAVVAPVAAMATPYLQIGTQQEWAGAMAAGRITPVPASTFQAMMVDEQWPVEYREQATFFTPILEVMTSDWQGEPGLVMSWGPPEDPGTFGRMAAAWDYTYPLDPSLNGMVIHFSIFPPVPSTLFSLNLIDQFGNYREWIWHAGNPGELPPFQWSDLWIDPVTGATNWPTFGGSPFIHNIPSGPPFDLNSIQILRFDENISSAPGFPPGPGGGIPAYWVWNAWDHVAVNPEPATVILLGGGLLALARRRRNRR
jgi:hypothetical protein